MHFVLAGIMLCFSLNAQTIRLSQKYTTQAVVNPSFNSYLVNDYYYVIQDKFNMKSPINRDVQMDVFDNKGEFVSSTGLIDAEMNMSEPNIWEGIFPLTDKMVLFKSQYVKEGDNKHYDLYAYPFSNLTQRDNGIKITSTASESGTNTGNFFISSSPDGSKVAVLVQHPFIKGARESCTVIVFDNAFKELWNKKYDFPFDNVKSPDNILWVNNSGSVFMLKKVENKTEDPYQSVITFTSNGSVIKENRLAMGEAGKTSSYGTAFNTQGDLVMAGLYFNDRKFGINVDKPKGFFILKVNAGDGVASSGFSPGDFPVGTKTISMNLLPNNEVIITAEEQIINSTPIPGQTFEYNYEYVNGNIFVTRLNAKGEVQWQHVAKRDIKSFNDGGKSNSVFTGIINGNVSLVYRDCYYKYDGKHHAVISFPDMSKYINVHRALGMDGNMVSDTYIKRLGNDDSKEAVIIYLMPPTGKQQDEKNVLFMGCTEKILYGVKVSF